MPEKDSERLPWLPAGGYRGTGDGSTMGPPPKTPSGTAVARPRRAKRAAKKAS